MTDTTSKLMDGLQRSWLLKLVWVLVPLAPIFLGALSKHATGISAGWLSSAALVVMFGGLTAAYGFARFERRRKRIRLRRLSPLQRVQMSDETDLVPIHESLRIADHPPVDTLPGYVQAAIAFWGIPLPKPFSEALLPLTLLVFALLAAIVMMDDPMGALSRWLSVPLLPYWPAFAVLAVSLVILLLLERLARMHQHYVAEAKASGRRPFPAL